jgi:hypothetical protein
MQIEIIQPDEDKSNYFERICEFLAANGIKTRESLSSRFDCLMTEFAMKHNGFYDAAKRKLTIK